MKKIIFYILFGLSFIAFSATAADVVHTGSVTYNQFNGNTNTGAITINNGDIYTNLGTIDINMQINHIDSDHNGYTDNCPGDGNTWGGSPMHLYGIKDGSAGDKQLINKGSIDIYGQIYCNTSYGNSMYGIVLGDDNNHIVQNTSFGHLNIDTGGRGISFGSGNNIFDNQGSMTIKTSSESGIIFGSGNDIFKNAGDQYVSITSVSHGVNLGDGNNIFENTGNSLNITTTGGGAHGILSGVNEDNLTNSGVLNINAGSDGIYFDDGDDILTNTATGDINITSNSTGIDFDDDDDILTNHGNIYINAGSDGIDFYEENDILTNHGNIYINAGSAGIDFEDDYDMLENAATGNIYITSGGTGIDFDDEDDNLTNHGYIDINSTGGTGIDFGYGDDILTNTATGNINITSDSDGIDFDDDDDILTNHGYIDINSTGGTGINFSDGDDILTNTATGNINITSDSDGIDFYEENDILTNHGNIYINAGSAGIDFEDDYDMLENAATGNIYITSGGIGIDFEDEDDNLTNHGYIDINSTGDTGINFGNGVNIFNNTATGNINIAANNNGITFEDGDDNLTNEGKLDITTSGGNPAITMGAGNDTVTLAGDVNTTGGIDGGDDTDTLTLTGIIDSSIDGVIANFETINKEGDGIWRLNGGDVTGTATDNFNHKQGTLYLGNNNLSGNYTQSPGATLLMNVTKTTADLLNVMGTGTTADITDGILLVKAENDEIWDTATDSWNRWTEAEANTFGSKLILNATALTGDFAEIKYKSLLFHAEADYSNANQVYLNITRGLTVNELQNKSSIAPTTNQTAIGNWLEKAISLNINKPLISSLINLSDAGADAVKLAINTLSPEPVSGSITAGRANSSAHTSNLSQRLNAYHKAGGKAAAAKLAAGLASDYFPIMYANPAQKELSGSLWIKTSYLTAEADPEDQFKFDMDTQGVTIGADTPFGNLILGASGGYSKSNVEYDTVVSESDIQTLNLNLYGSYKAKNYFIDTVLSYSNHSADTEREIAAGMLKETAKSDYDANEYGVYLNFGYPFEFNNGWTITPNASLQYSKYEQDAFTEKSASNAGLIVSGTDTDSIASGLGFSVEKVIEYPVWKIIPSLSVLWRHEFADTADTIEANFAEYENDLGTFKIEGYDQGADTFATQIGLTVYNGANTELFLNYDLGVKKDFIANSVTAGLKFYF